MRKHFITNCLMFACFTQFLFAQEDTSKYWQQTVNYKITASLNDEKHLLDANIEMEYINNSPEDLSFIYMHLWPNAYKNESTAFAQQKLEEGSTKFYLSQPSERGNIDGLQFEAKGKPLTLSYDEKHIDIAKVTLNEPLKSGDTLIITTPFTVKIPNSVSRLGHVGQSYQITQWYPKPAVFDKDGWHPMPYLDQGEFYSEFGSFDVTITVPKNYVVGATGDLQNEEEIAWLDQKAADTDTISLFMGKNDFPPSSEGTKTLNYKQDNVHDFAWFADKRFHVLKSEVKLPNSERTVTSWAMFTNEEGNLWRKATEYINDAVYFYSKHVGEYPYNHATAVQSALSAGAGMEYPTITVIGLSRTAKALETVIVHEVGHNWFYGILGSNERDHAWMDEGINSFYENKYIDEKYKNKPSGMSVNLGFATNFFDIAALSEENLRYQAYLLGARKGEDQPINHPSGEYTPFNYFSIVYTKAALAFKYLETYLGEEKFSEIMHEYYQRFEFKHPQPDDIHKLFEEKTGKNLDWFFNDFTNTTKKIDYKIKDVVKNAEKIGDKSFDKITIKNAQPNKNVGGAYPLSAIKGDSTIHTVWYDGFSGTMDITFPTMDYDRLEIDKGKAIPELYRDNNVYRMNGLFKRQLPLKLKLFADLENPKKNQIFFAPIAGWNNYDKFMAGIAFYNSLLPRRKFEYALAPLFSFSSVKVVGLGKVNYNWYPVSQGPFKKITLGVSGQSFGQGFFNTLEEKNPIKYYKIAPYLELGFREKRPRELKHQTIRLRHINLLTDKCGENFQHCNDLITTDSYINEVTFSYVHDRPINPHSAVVTLQQGKEFVLTSLELNHNFAYNGSKKHGFDVRLFAGGFLTNDAGQQLTLNDRGNRDFVYDDLYLGRNELDGILTNQIAIRYGGFKLPVSVGFADKAIFALNLKTTLPKQIPLPIRFYADFGIALGSNDLAYPWNGELLFDTGLAFTPLPNRLEIYFPLLQSKRFTDALDVNGRNYWKTITFQLNLNKLNPLQSIRNFNI